MWYIKLMERFSDWSMRRMLKRRFPKATAQMLDDIIAGFASTKKPSDEWSASFMTSDLCTELRCQCGVTYIAGETLSPIMRAHYEKVIREGGTICIAEAQDKLLTWKISGKIHAHGCSCVRERLRKQEQFVRANRDAILEYLTVTDEFGTAPPKAANRMKRETNETD